MVRFDDICPTMNWEVWDRVERMLDASNIKPILAVVPDNRDPNLSVAEARCDFWDKVRSWQAKGWAIGLHGFQHVYETDHSGIVGLNARSEFAGVPAARQQEKIESALAIFQREGIRADVWIAPAHSFDVDTVRVLVERGIHVISDGYFLRPVRYLGVVWVPAQIWRFSSFRRGLWTVCFHHNRWNNSDLTRFENDLSGYRERIISLQTLMNGRYIPDITLFDRIFFKIWSVKLVMTKKTKNKSMQGGIVAAFLRCAIHLVRGRFR